MLKNVCAIKSHIKDIKAYTILRLFSRTEGVGIDR